MVRDERERLADLMADRATAGLAPEEEAELRELLGRDPEADPESWELAAAAVDLALAAPSAAMPESLERKILEQARAFQADRSGAKVVPLRPVPSPAPRPSRSNAAWWLAAAGLLLALAGWWPRLAGERPSSPVTTLAQADDLVTLPWAATSDPLSAATQGEVEWSTRAQQGVMRFEGLPANDPSRAQYQLWIFDAERDERYPVDGGVFDVPAGAREVTVPIDPKVKVFRPTLFAVTLERPGGVVVSSRERLVLTAAVKPAA